MKDNMNNFFQNNMNIVNPLIIKRKDSLNDSITFSPIITYVTNLPPIYVNSVQTNQTLSQFPPPKELKTFSNNISSINQAIFDINELTINNNTNLTNLNLYFLYNSKTANNEDKKKNKNLMNIKKAPEDSIRKTMFELKSNPKDKFVIKVNRTSKNNSQHKVKLKRPLNNTISLFKGNKTKTKKEIKDQYSFNDNNKYNNCKILTEPNKRDIEPKGNLYLSEFTQISQIGRGTFGKIFSVKWKKNNKKYALKKEIINDFEYIQKRQNIIKIIKDFLEKTKNKGVIQIYSNLYLKNKDDYNYYELMEIGEHDLENEINERRNKNLLYTEGELINIASQLIKTLSLLQKNHITHRDIKPQNILRVNGLYKLCDFGEIRIMKRDGVVVQRIRGSELYMSPILFYGLRENLIQVRHNTYKSDVFSLGMCLIYAATMYFNCIDEIREIIDMKKINFVLNKYLEKKYSNKFITLICIMLQIDENYRPDFIDLEKELNNIYNM